ncbi:MAG: septum formation inhibitor Maf [Burkholderiaceae bacterium]|nr:septum formation inhibitor Maf [Burkholderiaceae bacterium]
MKIIDNKIYLASKSPRRRELLRQIGVEFELLLLRGEGPRGPDVTETVHPGEAPADYVARVCGEKADFAWNVLRQRRVPLRPVLTADTTVTLDGAILGKPADQAEALDMLNRLAGRSHQVLTAVALRWGDQAAQITQVSEVTFGPISDEAIAHYCAGREPYDKAGGYGIQGSAAQFVEHIDGSHSGIMGLPLFETAQLLRQAGIRLL